MDSLHKLHSIPVILPDCFYILKANIGGKIKNDLYINSKILARGVDLEKPIELNDDHTLIVFTIEGLNKKFSVQKDPEIGWMFPIPVKEQY